jgi:Trk K+ transport system NAD-binding subunit
MLAHPTAPLAGYQVAEIAVTGDSAAAGRKLNEITWPQAGTPVSVLRGRQLGPPDPGLTLTEGDRVSLLIPVTAGSEVPASGRPG